MPVTGIESILCTDYHNFEPLLFRDSPVIVDASDFASYYNGKDISHIIFGGEYLSLAIVWNRILGNLHKCSIDPLFIFSASSERRGFQLSYELTGFHKWLACLKLLLNGEANDSMLNFNPIMLTSTLVDLLDAVHVSHLCSAYNNHRSCASMAHRMRCPVLATSPEYLSMSAPLAHVSYAGFAFIPLQCVNPEPVELRIDDASKRDVTRSGKKHPPVFALASHRFIPCNAGFSRVAPIFRPLLFLLLGTDSLPRVRLPNPMYTLMKSIDGSDYKTRRWNSLLVWLSQFPTGSVYEPIEQICRCYPAEEQDTLLHTLRDCLETYMPDKSIERRLSLFLLESHVPQHELNGAKSKLLASTPVPELKLSDVTPKQELCAVLKGNKPLIKLDCIDFTEHWPEDMVKCFYRSNLANIVLISLYAANGLVLPRPIEDVSLSESIWDASLPLRILHYSYLAGLEFQLGGKEKFTGDVVNVVEYVRIGDKQVRRCISVQPCHIDPKQDTTDDILTGYLGIPISAHTSPLLSLIVALSVWYKREVASQAVPSPFDRSPTALAILLCAVANEYNFHALDESLLAHYEENILFAESKVGFVAPSTQSRTFHSDLFNVHVVHQFNCVQSAYLCLRSAVALLDHMLPQTRQSKVLSFAPAWKVFPSGRLVHALALCLSKIEPNSRRHVSVRFWLPRLVRSTASRSPATSLFDHSLDVATQFVTRQRDNAFNARFVDEPVGKINVESFESLRRVAFGTGFVSANQNFIGPKADASKRFIDDTQVKMKEHVNHLTRNSSSTQDELRPVKKYGRRSPYAERLKARLLRDQP